MTYIKTQAPDRQVVEKRCQGADLITKTEVPGSILRRDTGRRAIVFSGFIQSLHINYRITLNKTPAPSPKLFSLHHSTKASLFDVPRLRSDKMTDSQKCTINKYMIQRRTIRRLSNLQLTHSLFDRKKHSIVLKAYRNI